MFGSASSLQNSNFNAVNSANQTVSNNRLTQQQTHYLERVNKRKAKIRAMLNDDSPLMVHFSYEVDMVNAAQRNKELENMIRTSQAAEDMDECADRFKRVTEKCPDLSTVAIVPIKGLPGIIDRIQAGTAAHKKLIYSLQLIQGDSQTLKTNSMNMKRQMEEIRRRHSSLSHGWLRILKLIEDASISTGIYETNVQNQQNTEVLLRQIEMEFKWNDWQQHLRVLHSQLNALLQSGQITTPYQQIEDKQMKSIYNLLNLKAEAIEALSIETLKVDKNVQKVEDVLSCGAAPQSKGI